MADLVELASYTEIYTQLQKDKRTIAAAFGVTQQDDNVLDAYLGYAEKLAPMVCDTAELLNDAVRSGKRILLEGAQGTMLDIDHGTYPYVTSSSAASGGAATGTGLPPTRINGIIGVSKAYITRVGGGPFPSEDHGERGEAIRKAGNEYGSVTGRPRRCGWFDVPLLKYTAMVNGFDSLIVTKLDVLDTLDEIPVCVGYKINGSFCSSMPASQLEFAKVEPVYEMLPGWRTPTFGMDDFDALPERARAYLHFLAEKTQVEVGSVSTGPERNQTLIVPGSKLAALLS
jgi:adenylosuccinate synthase